MMMAARLRRISGSMQVAGGGTLAALAVLLIYWPARLNGFVGDDWTILDIDDSAELRDPSLWREALLRSPADVSALYRPVTMFTFLLQLWTGQLEPQAFHLVNLVIHSVNVFLLVLLSSRLPGNEPRNLTGRLLAVLCGLIYGVHPALTEPVLWISARSDLLLTFFLLLAMFLDQVLVETGWRKAVTVGSLFFAAMLCKESAVGLLLALPVVHLAVDSRRPGLPAFGGAGEMLAQHHRVYAALAGALVLYFIVRFFVTGSALSVGGAVSPAVESYGQHILIVIASLAQHIWSALWPFQNIEPARHLSLPVNGMEVWPTIVASAGAIILALAAVRTNSSGRAPALLFLAFVASLLPVANIVLIPAVAVWDEVAVGSRYLTFPLVLACLAVPFVIRLTEASLVKHGYTFRTLLWAIVGAWVVASVANVRITIPLWSNDLALNTWAIQQGSASFWHQGHIGSHYLLTGDYSRSREASLAALKLRDDDQTAWVWNNLGVAEANLGHTVEAARAFRRALELGTDEIRSRIYLAIVEREMGNAAIAASILEEGLRRISFSGRPDKLEAHLRYQLGLAYAALGRPEDAAIQQNAALALARNPVQRRAIEEAPHSFAPR